MPYPTLEQYNEALQHPQLALLDPTLKTGSITKTGLGLPLALCGGFALTYTLKTQQSKFAIRCFHKQSNALEARYKFISNKLKSIKSSYFLDFEFQPVGISVSGGKYPLVKMLWASGVTLGEFLEGNYKNSKAIGDLRSSLTSLAAYLDQQGIAHGDIQPGNVMVSNAGRTLQLIDYDGIFVEELKALGSSEIGHRNFQHPLRNKHAWNSKLDRFSFISLNLALRAIEHQPSLWMDTQSDGDTIIFKANDFSSPDHSTTFSKIASIPQLNAEINNFARVCNASFDDVPSLANFLEQKNIPVIKATFTPALTTNKVYISSFDTCDASNYNHCFKYVGEKIELIGKVVEVKYFKNEKTGEIRFIFINFGHWQGKILKINIWGQILPQFAKYPDDAWVGKWISITGLLEPPYKNAKLKYEHLAISISNPNQLHRISEQEAKFRLSKASNTRPSIAEPSVGNQEILNSIQEKIPSSGRRAQTGTRQAVPKQVMSQNEALLMAMKGAAAAAGHTTQRAASPNPTVYKQSNSPKPANKWSLGAKFFILALAVILIGYIFL